MKKRTQFLLITAAVVVCLAVALVVIWQNVLIPKQQYDQAIALRDSGQYGKAAIAFAKLGDYKDAPQQCLDMWEKSGIRETIFAGDNIIAAVKENGTVLTATQTPFYGMEQVRNWTDIIAISIGHSHMVGLKADGTVVAAGADNLPQCNLADWQDIVAISAGSDHTVGLKKDGTVVYAGDVYSDQAIHSWTDIVAISAGDGRTVGLKSDGTVLITWHASGKSQAIDTWTNVVAISAKYDHIVALTDDGFMINEEGHPISNQSDIIAIQAGHNYTIGLRSEGTVVLSGDGIENPLPIMEWKNIVAISAGYNHVIGLKSDGTLVGIAPESSTSRPYITGIPNISNIKLP